VATNELSNLFQQAAEIASLVPEGLQTIAFEKALEIILVNNAAITRRRTPQRVRTAGQHETLGGGRGVGRAAARAPGRVGPKSALSQLLEQGYFAIRREIADIQSHLKDSHGHEYSSKELAVSLLRLVREGGLKRGKSAEGQYQYWTERRLLT
jgi:hypothetical protein